MDKDNSTWNLPEHEPDRGLWDAIEQQLGQLPAYQPVEEAVESLNLHNPDPDLWNKIENDLGNEIPLWFEKPYFKYLLAVAAILLIIGISFLFTPNKSPGGKTVIENNQFIQQDVLNKEPDESKINQVSNTLDNPKASDSDVTILPPHSIENSQAAHSGRKQQQLVNAKSRREPNSGKNVQTTTNEPGQNDITDENAIAREQSDVEIVRESQIVDIQHPEAETFLMVTNDENPEDTSFANHFTLGLHYAQIVAATADCDGSDWNNYAIEASVSWYRKNFIIESGLAVSMVKSKPLVGINYLQNEQVGSFEQVDSVHYQVDENNPQDIDKIYYLSEVDVYDSVEHFILQQPHNDYTYLNIPLYLGYRLKFNKVGLSLKVGTVFSFLINKKITSPDLPSDARVLAYENYPPNYPKQQWRLVFGAAIDFRIVNHLGFIIEPQYNYFFKQLSGCKQQQHKLNIRIGLLYNF